MQGAAFRETAERWNLSHNVIETIFVFFFIFIFRASDEDEDEEKDEDEDVAGFERPIS